MSLFFFLNLQEKIEAINQALVNEYEVRRKMLLKRLDVTVQSFGWSIRAKVQESLFYFMHIKTLIKLVEWAKMWRELNLKSFCFVILYRHMLINFRKCTSLFEWCWPLKPEYLWPTCLLLEKIYQRSWEPAVVTPGRKQPVPLTRWVRFECTFAF